MTAQLTIHSILRAFSSLETIIKKSNPSPLQFNYRHPDVVRQSPIYRVCMMAPKRYRICKQVVGSAKHIAE